MAFYQFTKEQTIKANLEDVWEFISSPKNLKKITPSYLGFEITTPNFPDRMYEGMIISYKVSPLLGIKTNWVTEITHLKEKEFFVDEQRIGPYKMWHHQHYIERTLNGVLMKDIITYKPPLAFIGSIANTLIIKKQLENIFDYRRKALDKIFEN